MYPYDIVFGLDLYDLAIVIGFFGALVYFRFWADRRGFSAGFQNLCIVGGLFGIVGGYGVAVITQAFYNYMESGKFEISGTTGATFYGGLIGGAAAFLLVYFIGGHLILKNGIVLKNFFSLSEIAAGSIALAHGFGRLGCLFAGCCHGAPTDAWYGINMMNGSGEWVKCVPTQLFEAIFLMLLFGFLVSFSILKKKLILPFYLIIYGVWRFAIEYLRDDYRGDTFIEALTPSQLIALVLVVIGIALIFVEVAVTKYIAGLEKNETERKNESNA